MTTKQARGGALLASVAFLGIALLVAVFRPAFGHGGNLRAVTALMNDFALNVYYPSRALLDRVNPYDQATYLARYPVDSAFPPYLPVTLLLHLPFACLPFHEAALAYLCVSVALVTLLAWISLRFCGRRSGLPMALATAALIVLSRPGRQLLVLGQPAIEFILATYLALYYARRFPLASGLGLALSLSKPTFGLPLGALMLARRTNKTAVTFGAAFTVLLNLPVLAMLAFRAGSVSALWHTLVAALHANQGDPSFLVVNPATSSLRVDMSSLLSRVVGHALDGAAQGAVMLAVLTGAAFAIRRSETSPDDRRIRAADSILCIAALLSIYHQAYDLVLLTMPFAALAARRLPPVFNANHFRLPLLGLYTVLAANYAASYSVLSKLHLVPVSGEPTSPTGGLWLLLVSVNGLALLSAYGLYLFGALRPGSEDDRDHAISGRTDSGG